MDYGCWRPLNGRPELLQLQLMLVALYKCYAFTRKLQDAFSWSAFRCLCLDLHFTMKCDFCLCFSPRYSSTWRNLSCRLLSSMWCHSCCSVFNILRRSFIKFDIFFCFLYFYLLWFYLLLFWHTVSFRQPPVLLYPFILFSFRPAEYLSFWYSSNHQPILAYNNNGRFPLDSSQMSFYIFQCPYYSRAISKPNQK